jgi:hypothetical protein
MTSSAGSSGEGPKLRRPAPPVIELKATEIGREPAEPATTGFDLGSHPQDERGRSESAQAADGSSAAHLGKGDERVHPREEEPQPGLSTRPNVDRSLLQVGAGVLAGVLVVLLPLWLAGVLHPREEAALAERLAAAETQLRALAGGLQTVRADEVAALTHRVAALETTVREVAARPQAVSQRWDELSARLAALEQGLRRLDELAARQGQPGSAAGGVPDATVAARLAAAEAGLAAVAERLSTVTRQLDETAAAARVTDHGKTAMDRAVEGDRAARLAFAAVALRTAVERGEPYATELEALRLLVSDPAVLAPLEASAVTGVPTAAGLVREWKVLAPNLLSAAVPTSGSGILDRLRASAERLVRIRPVGEVAGDDPAAVVSRVEAKVGRDDVEGALADLAKLSAPVRAHAEAWRRKAQTRAQALAASRRLAEEAVAAMVQAAARRSQ